MIGETFDDTRPSPRLRGEDGGSQMSGSADIDN
jgi:hypothetical protein